MPDPASLKSKHSKVADDDYKNDAICNLVKSCEKLDSIREVDSEDMWTTCEISGITEHRFDTPRE